MKVEEWLGESNNFGLNIWRNKYQHNDESFDEWLDRISNGNEAVKKLIIEKKFLFGGRILANRGLDKLGEKITLSNCYVLSQPEDNIESIFDTSKKMARTFSYGGGVGIDISKLAPKGAKVHNTAKNTTGSISFMDLYSMTTGLIGQNGRRGALMISISCDHPDVEDFISIKSDLNRINFANISVKVTDKFMNAVVNNEDFTLHFERPETGEVIEKTVKAKELFDKLVYQNWDYAEPGILYWDRISNWNLLSNNPEFEYAGTNPCAEEPLPAGGSCLLGSINLSEYVNDCEFNYKEFANDVKECIKALNEVLDEGMPLHPLQEQRDSVRDWRQIGLGMMGLGDALIKQEITYGSREAIKFVDKVGKVLINAALQESAKLAAEKGPYPKYNDLVLESDFFKENANADTVKLVQQFGLRNSQLLTTAPTGSISNLLGISGGIEPIFAGHYTRMTKSLHGHDEVYDIYTGIFKDYMDSHNIKDGKDLPEWFVDSADITPVDRVKMQGAAQKHIDASISSTVNLPNKATEEDVATIYTEAWKNGLKGITIYRAGCKREAILNAENEKKDDVIAEVNSVEDVGKEGYTTVKWGTVLPVRFDLDGMKTKIKNGCGHFHLQLFYDEATGKPWETFISMGSGGGCERNLETISKSISKLLRSGVSINEIIEMLKQTRACPAYINKKLKGGDVSPGTSCPGAIGYALENFMKKIETRKEHQTCEVVNNIEELKESIEHPFATSVCPECGQQTLIHEGGCNRCMNPECTYSKCE